MKEKTLTVFTPTYNRARTLTRTYESLKKQTDKDFIWLIIDDGSDDETPYMVDQWIKENNGFEIQYYKKKNGGMHTAHNLAYSLIHTELNVCIDSDDSMPETAVHDIISFWQEMGANEYAGIIALDSDMQGNVIGTRLPSNVKNATTREIYEKYKVTGDKKFIYRTDVINSVPPYPEFKGEKLVPLGFKYLQVDDFFSMLLLDKVVCNVDYQIGGSSNTIYKQYMQSPRGFAIDKVIRMTRTHSLLSKMKYIIHYIAECRIAKDSEWLNKSPYKTMSIVMYPFGWMLEKYIYIINKRSDV